MKHLLVLLITALALPTAVEANILKQYEKRNANKCSFNNAQFKASAYIYFGNVYAFDDDSKYKYQRYCITSDNRIILYRKGAKQEGYRDYSDYQEGLVGYQTSDWGSSLYTITLWVIENNKLYRLSCYSDQSDECSKDIKKNLMGEKIDRRSTIIGLDNKETGYGTQTWKDGDKYVGDFVEGKKSGKGTYYWKDGHTYVGDWLDDNRTGKGTITWKSGTKYVGDFVENKKSGKGTFYWNNGDIYVGDWLDDKITGKGTFTWKDGEKYVGDFVEGKKSGKGTFYWNDGDIYVGDWLDDNRTGYGELKNKHGRIINKGQWLNNKRIRRD